tara:strand:+ start:280 stop:543 length:264 start_codon:yes stop_codon:yes gene_type:complete
MSRELNIKQQEIILSEIYRNKVSRLENPYVMSANSFNDLMEENDHETLWDNVQYFIYDFKQNDEDEFYLDEWQSIKYEAYKKNKFVI